MSAHCPQIGSYLKRGAVALILTAFGVGTAQASVISPTPTLPPPNGVYVGAGAPDCFAAVNVCVGAGTLAITSVISSIFSLSGQDLELEGVYTSTLTTDVGHMPLGKVTLAGTIEEDIAGRLGPTDTGSWTTGLDALDLSGTVLGDPVSVGLDPGNPTNGMTSIAPMGPDFLIASFFDVFVEIQVTTPEGPLMVTRGPLRVDLEPVPEPATLALLGLPLASIAFCRRRSGSRSRRSRWSLITFA